MRYLLIGLAILFASPAWALPKAGDSLTVQTQVQYLSGKDKDNRVNWEFMVNGGRNSGAWKTIPVPSNWEMEGFGTYRYFNDWTDPVPDTTGMYRHRFEVPASWKDRQVDIVFGAAMTDTEVKINGQLAGPIHQGGFYEFRYNISSLLKPGASNLLEVTVKRFSANESVNQAERSSDYWMFSGIFRPVWLESRPLANIERVNLDARHTGDFSAEVTVVGKGTRVSAQLTTLDDKPVGKPFSAPVENGVARLRTHAGKVTPWSAEHPQRYRVRFQYLAGQSVVHELTKTIGFRTIELRKHDGLYVNNVKVRLKGSNRHSIWPTSGRTTSLALSYQDAKLMKEMNMNAVRMSHYPPDEHFLDVADEVGLYVIDELAGWQKKYDTDVATPLVGELVRRDQHHPSVILWANGNEGGFNHALDDLYAKWDLQKRPVIHPWANFGGMDTAHYTPFDCCATSLHHGRDVFMPTEFMHALYDGGAAAGLADFWNAMLANPLNAGGFIWAFADEGIVRADKNGVIDTAGNLAPDGIVGPYREKEGSFFAVKEIWSPLYLPLSELSHLPASFDGRLVMENRYDFTNLNRLKLKWKLSTFGGANVEGSVKAPDVAAGMRGQTRIDLPKDWSQHDALYLTAVDHTGMELYTWSWMISGADKLAKRSLENWSRAKTAGQASIDEAADGFKLRAGDTSVVIDKATGYLRELKKGATLVPLSNGPRLVTGSAVLKTIKAEHAGEDLLVRAEYSGNMRHVVWRLKPNGALSVNYAYYMENGRSVDALGVSFDYPEKQVTAMRWLGKGPYRVWKNRTHGVEFNVWEKAYNDTITGVSWNYPEFKGFHDKVYWAELATRNLPLTFVNRSDDIALRVFTPGGASGAGAEPKDTKVSFPAGDISFMHAIIPIGTKFHPTAQLGPQSAPHRTPNLGIYLENTVDILVGEARP